MPLKAVNPFQLLSAASPKPVPFHSFVREVYRKNRGNPHLMTPDNSMAAWHKATTQWYEHDSKAQQRAIEEANTTANRAICIQHWCLATKDSGPRTAKRPSREIKLPNDNRGWEWLNYGDFVKQMQGRNSDMALTKEDLTAAFDRYLEVQMGGVTRQGQRVQREARRSRKEEKAYWKNRP